MRIKRAITFWRNYFTLKLQFKHEKSKLNDGFNLLVLLNITLCKIADFM